MDHAKVISHETLHGRVKDMLSQDQWSDIRLMAKSGKPIKQIAREVGASKNTIKRIIRSEMRRPYQRTALKPSLLEEYMPFLLERAPGVYFNATILFRELQDRGYTGSYSTVKTAVKPLRDTFFQAQTASIRFETPPGHQAQMDWGSSWVTIDGQRTRVRIFVMILCYSRTVYVEFSLDEKLPTLISCHERAFHWFGGVTEEILYDNPRTIVLNRGTDSARLNPKFEDFCRHYGYQARLCRPYRAQTKGKVESGVKYVKRSFLPGRTFASLEDMNHQVWQWIRTVADQRIHGTVYEKPADRFLRETLQPIGNRPAYLLETCEVRQVASDCLVSYQASRYSVPWNYARQVVDVQERGGLIHIYHRGKLIAEHAKATGKHQMILNREHYKGLMKQEPWSLHQKRSGWPASDVQIRSLGVYEAAAGGAIHG